MIARIWHGAVPAAVAEAYARYVEETGTREARRTPGNRGVVLLRRIDGPRAEFLFTSFWDSLEAIRRFAGSDLDRAVYYPRDREFLVALEPTVQHYEVVDEPAAGSSAHAEFVDAPAAGPTAHGDAAAARETDFAPHFARILRLPV